MSWVVVVVVFHVWPPEREREREKDGQISSPPAVYFSPGRIRGR